MLAYLFAAVMVVVALSVFRTGRLTSDKMEMQNAADAMAYSASVIEARDLNFASYMNRAIVANEVAIGQAVGLASWAFHWNSIGDWLQEYDRFLTGPTLGISSSFLQPAAAIFNVSGGVFIPLLSNYAKLMTGVNHNVNKGYSIAQRVYHIGVVLQLLGMLEEVKNDNVSNPDAVRISNHGWLMLFSHLATYGNLQDTPLVSSALGALPEFDTFTESSDPEAIVDVDDFLDPDTETDADGFAKLAALVHNSGDPFTKGWHNPQYNADPSLNGRGWEFVLFEVLKDSGFLPFLPIDIPFVIPFAPVPGTLTGDVDSNGNFRFDFDSSFDFDIGIASAGYDLNLYVFFGLSMERQGGSELRMVVPLTGTNRDKAAGELFSWSSADATSVAFSFGAGGSISGYISALGLTVRGDGSLGLELDGRNEELTFYVSLSLGIDAGILGSVDVTVIDETVTSDFPASIPIGTAFTQAAKKTPVSKKNALTANPIKHSGNDFLGGPLDDEAYGGAPTRIIPWSYPPTGEVAGIAWLPDITVPRDNNVGSTYGGLPRYIDATDNKPLYGSAGPRLVIGLQMSHDDFEAEHYDEHADQKPEGRFDLSPFEEFGNDNMSVLAKSEVYFKRPLDLDQFARGDGYVEHGSAFNPYWQARLVETSHTDRIAALAIQHGEYAQGGPVGDLVDWFAGVLGL